MFGWVLGSYGSSGVLVRETILLPVWGLESSGPIPLSPPRAPREQGGGEVSAADGRGRAT